MISYINWDNTRFAIRELRNLGFDIGHTETPIIPIYVRDDYKTFRLTRMLLEEGIFVNPVISPAVKSSDSLIRFSLMATHTKEQITYAIEKLEKVSKVLDVPKLQKVSV
ncbi:MAG: aminotransferase class I/II-fold pyridoxal phosphate-dependent enzyme [Bacteroidota bacterium]